MPGDGFVTVFAFFGLALDQHLTQRRVLGAAGQRVDLLLVVVVDEGLDRRDGGVDRTRAEDRRQRPGGPCSCRETPARAPAASCGAATAALRRCAAGDGVRCRGGGGRSRAPAHRARRRARRDRSTPLRFHPRGRSAFRRSGRWESPPAARNRAPAAAVPVANAGNGHRRSRAAASPRAAPRHARASASRAAPTTAPRKRERR